MGEEGSRAYLCGHAGGGVTGGVGNGNKSEHEFDARGSVAVGTGSNRGDVRAIRVTGGDGMAADRVDRGWS